MSAEKPAAPADPEGTGALWAKLPLTKSDACSCEPLHGTWGDAPAGWQSMCDEHMAVLTEIHDRQRRFVEGKASAAPAEDGTRPEVDYHGFIRNKIHGYIPATMPVAVSHLEDMCDEYDDLLAERDSARRALDEAQAEVERLTIEKAGVEGERDAADDFAASIREILDVPDADGWGREVRERIESLLRAGTIPQVHSPEAIDQLAALFRSAPGGQRLGDEPPGIIARIVLDAGFGRVEPAQPPHLPDPGGGGQVDDREREAPPLEWAVIGWDVESDCEFIDTKADSRERATEKLARFYSGAGYRDARVVCRTQGDWQIDAAWRPPGRSKAPLPETAPGYDELPTPENASQNIGITTPAGPSAGIDYASLDEATTRVGRYLAESAAARTVAEIPSPPVRRDLEVLLNVTRLLRTGPRVEGAGTVFLRWLASMGDPDDKIGQDMRRTVTLTHIIDRARAVLGGDQP